MQPDSLFKHSGRVSLPGLMTAMMKAAAYGSLLGALYGVISYYSPFFVINMAVLIGISIALGTVMEGPVHGGHIRNTAVAVLVGAFAGVVALAVHWVVWLRFMSGGWLLDLGSALTMLKAIALLGPWSISDWTPQGATLYTIWAIEALVIFVMPTVMARNSVRDTPYCETTGTWAEVEYTQKNFAACDIKSMTQQLLQNPSSVVSLLNPATNTDTEFTRFGLGQVPGSNLRTVSISKVTTKIKDGKVEEDSKTLLNHLIVDSPTFDKVLAACS